MHAIRAWLLESDLTLLVKFADSELKFNTKFVSVAQKPDSAIYTSDWNFELNQDGINSGREVS